MSIPQLVPADKETVTVPDGLTVIDAPDSDIEQLLERAEAAGVDTKKTLVKATKRVTAKEKREREDRQFWARTRVEDWPFWQTEHCPQWCVVAFHNATAGGRARQHQSVLSRTAFTYDALSLTDDNLNRAKGLGDTAQREPGVSIQAIYPSGARRPRVHLNAAEGANRVSGTFSVAQAIEVLGELALAIELACRPVPHTQAEAKVAFGLTAAEEAPDDTRIQEWTGIHCDVSWCHSDHADDPAGQSRVHHGRFGKHGVQLSVVETTPSTYDAPKVFLPPTDDALDQDLALAMAVELAAAAAVVGRGEFRGDVVVATRGGAS